MDRSKILPLINHINAVTSLSQEEENLLLDLLQLRQVRRKQYILNEGDSCKFYTFILTGCFRMFMVDQKGSEHIIQFGTENWWIADIGSFHSGNPSQFYIEALEPSEILQIDKNSLLKLFKHSSKFDRYFRILIENAFIKTQERVVQNISSTAEERYQSFLASYEHLLQRIPQVHIASFIGITPEFLSKIRKNLIKP